MIMKHLKKYSDFYEDGCSTGCGSGSGDVSNPVVGTLPGVPGKPGSGDVSRYLTSGGKKRKKGGPSEVSDLRDLEDAKTNKDPYSVDITESMDESGEEYEDIKWALIDFIDEGFDLRIKKYDDPEDIQEMTIAMNASLAESPDVITGNNEIRGNFKDGRFEATKVSSLWNPSMLHFMMNLKGKDKEWLESLESACLRLLDLEEYDHGSFSISKTSIPSGSHVSVNIHIHMMKNPEK